MAPILAHFSGFRLRPSGTPAAECSVPTMEQAGYPGFVSTSWTGLLAPAATPAEIVGKLNAQINAGLKTPQLLTALESHVGATYHFNRTGPETFDCSGLVWRAFQDVGIDFQRGPARSYWATFSAPASISAMVVPTNVTVTNSGFTSSNTITIALTSGQVSIYGVEQFTGGTAGQLTVTSSLGGTPLVVREAAGNRVVVRPAEA